MSESLALLLVVAAVADLPVVQVINPAEVEVEEDGNSIPLRITVGQSPDGDNSETLSVRITVPKDGGTPIGTIGGTLPSGVSLQSEGDGKFLVTAEGATADARARPDTQHRCGGRRCMV